MALPVVLAGPVLRRCESSRVFVWFAIRRSARVTVQVWEATPGPLDPDKPFVGIGQAYTIPLGRRLHLGLVPVVPESGAGTFPTGRLLEYDIILELTNDRREVIGQPAMLSDSPEFQGESSIAYSPYRRPTFFLPDGDMLNILHGSCRKPHGEGDDALAVADNLIAAHCADLVERPSALFLTGDQIYADDVAEELARPVIDLGETLLGFGERIPVPGGGSVPLRGLVGGARGLLLAKIFTPDDAGVLHSSAARNHLMGFGEFAAMYLLSWNPATWPEGSRNATTALAASFQTIPKVRRALANIPTYMILDDHEVTDDWNRTRAWEERVQQSPTGRRLVTNAVAAYWAFQGWGNDPERFPADFAKPLVDYIASQGEHGDDYEKALYPANPDPNDPHGGGGPSRWQYLAPTNPPVIVLDARTRRGFDPDHKDEPPELLGATAIEHLRTLLRGLDVENQAVLVVAPTPMFGIPGMETVQESPTVQKAMGVYFAQTGAAASDLESWHANLPGMYRVLFAMHDEGVRACVILSGDVHYGFASAADFTTVTHTIHFTQFTSSALKNQTPWFMRRILNEAPALEPTRFEYAWRTSAEFIASVGRVAPPAIRAHLSHSPLVLTPDEMRAARLPTSRAQASLISALRVDSQHNATVIPSNLGQLRLADPSPETRADLVFHAPGSAGPLEKITLALDRFATLREVRSFR